MEVSANEVADVVLKEFSNWPQKRKPLSRTDGSKEWVPLSAIVAQQGQAPENSTVVNCRKRGLTSIILTGRKSLTCLAAATGMKCLPQNKILQAQGVVLHDWHAEVLAIRSFNRFLLDECRALAAAEKTTSEFIRVRSENERTEACFQPFALKDDIYLHMYCSEAPCGDASMELTMAAQDDPTPWHTPISSSDIQTISSQEPVLHGRSYFSTLGIVRRKPSRSDAPPTLSKSCSDKLALKQATSLLSSVTSLLISPRNCYITTLVLPSSQYSEAACSRAFSTSGRLAIAKEEGAKWKGGYSFKPFQVRTTEKEFAHSRRQVLSPGGKLVTSNISSFSTANPLIAETLIGGTLQGRKQFSLKGASLTSKRSMWKLALDIAAILVLPNIERSLRVWTYSEVKAGELLEARQAVKRDGRNVLGGWIRNEGGENFSLREPEVEEKKSQRGANPSR